jgi:predicted RNA-binding Zn-ribbon protein involved in translation (DUF1610 family)
MGKEKGNKLRCDQCNKLIKEDAKYSIFSTHYVCDKCFDDLGFKFFVNKWFLSKAKGKK